MACGQLLDAGHERAWRDNPSIGEELAQRLRVGPCGYCAGGEDRLLLRSEEQAVRRDRVVHRLDAEPVAGEHEALAPRVPEGEGKHSPQVPQQIRAVVL